MRFLRETYRVLRSVVFTAFILAAGLYLLVYVAVALPVVQDTIRDIAKKEASKFLGTQVKIGQVEISPFSQVILRDVDIPSQDGKKCITAGKIGAGISLRDLLWDKKIIITYAEILDLDARIRQEAKDKPLNIQFIIDAFKPKEPGKPPTIFDLKIRNIVIRRMSVSFDKEWIAPLKEKHRIDFNHLKVSNLALDLTLPRVSNDDYQFDLRRLSMEEKSGLKLTRLSMKGEVTDKNLTVKDLIIELPGTYIHPSEISISYAGMKDIPDALKNGRHRLQVINNKITLSDFAAFVPEFSHFNTPFIINLDADGTRNDININDLRISTPNERLRLNLIGSVTNVTDMKRIEAYVPLVKFRSTADEMSKIISYLSPLNAEANRILSTLGELNLDLKARYRAKSVDLKGIINSSLGNVDVNSFLQFPARKQFIIKGIVKTDGFTLTPLLPKADIGKVVFDINADLNISGKDINGKAIANIPLFEYKGNAIQNIKFDATKQANHIKGIFSIDDVAAALNAEADINMTNSLKSIIANANIDHFYPQNIGLGEKIPFTDISGTASADISLVGKDDLIGKVHISDVSLQQRNDKLLSLGNLDINAEIEEDKNRCISLTSDYLDAEMTGNFHFSRLPSIFQSMLSNALPSIIPSPTSTPSFHGENFNLIATVKNDNTLPELFNLPFRLLVDIPLTASFNGDNGTADVSINVPYLQQGKDKLISNTALFVNLNNNLQSVSIDGKTCINNKNGNINASISAQAINDRISTDMAWKIDRQKAYDGKISIAGSVCKNPHTGALEATANINPSVIHINDAKWDLEPAKLEYADGKLLIDGLRASHNQQFIDINGCASKSDDDQLTVNLRDIDLNYIFKTLNINYVTFGGMATGKVKASAAFSGIPKASTDGLFVKNLSYNDAVLGDAQLTSSFDMIEKKVSIRADIETGQKKNTVVDGAIWVTRDSLSFDLDANKVNIQFLQPFMAAFSSDVQGQASGHAKLYGTFSDIDLVGRLFADTIRMKLDYTNTYYSGSDSVYLDPGHITIPAFKLYDKYGNSGIFSGWLKHRYFHEPEFEFRLRDAHRLLCYDTDAKLNPDWYGKIFGNGSATITGDPEKVSIFVDMSTTPGSTFTFVLSENEAATDFRFLTFTDKQKEERLRQMPDTVPDFIKRFNKRIEQEMSPPADFDLDIRATINPYADIILVMDPVAGDKIKARGNGAFQLNYSGNDDVMTMYGEYVVAEGSYNFTLQDLIIKDFVIRPDSKVTFNGDPLQAVLDIVASYRVNTNLTDLDPSFANDRDLNRTNVPIEALLKVSGEIDNPEIKFDIELPTLTSDVERKVRSIISTEDMMNTQIIYLLALNRFYSPEYTNSGSNGGELASVASSTLSSHISNILGQLSDKWSIAPTFRSDKKDLSDLEFDVTLSSRLFNNRLLINGNLGYRDKNTSNTTFVGDFDIEYLLNRSGNLRLKAYNHYNDQNYYLKSALTTQGIGIIYRHDFDSPFTFIKRFLKHFRHNKPEKQTEEKSDDKGEADNSGNKTK